MGVPAVGIGNGTAFSPDDATRILEQLPVAVVVTDLDGDVSFANRASDDLLTSGGTGEAGQANGWKQRLQTSGPVQRVLLGGGIGAEEMSVDRRGADPVNVELLAGPIFDADQHVTHTASVLWDQSAHRVADGDRAVLAAIVRSTTDAIISIDREGNITSWNGAACDLYGYDAEEAMGSPIGMLYHRPEDPLPRMRQVLEGESVVYAEGERVHKDGTNLQVGETMSPVLDPTGSLVGVATISRDIGDRLQVEGDLAAARLELEARNRRLERSNSDLEQFAYVASHDLSEPLRAISGMVSLLARRYEGQLDSDADEFIGFAIDGCVRMRAMIDDLLLYSRAGRVELQRNEVDLALLVASVADSLTHQVDEADATLETGPLPVIRADESQMRQVVQNLISNAIKFRRPDEPVTVKVTAVRDGTTWRIEVADNGIGIEEVYRERIFRMFQRLHPQESYEGTGIGLAMVERIVDRHGGRAGVEGNAARGSTFWFTIPDTTLEAP